MGSTAPHPCIVAPTEGSAMRTLRTLPTGHRPARQVIAVAAVSAAALVSLLASPGAVAAARPGKPAFGPDVVLPGGQGGEPSLAIDTFTAAGRNDLYAVAIGDANGPLEWHSYDGGATWSAPVPFDTGGPLRGLDSDVAVNTNGDVLAADLDLTWASV